MTRPPEDTFTHRQKAVASISKDLVPITTKVNGADSKVPAAKSRNFLAGFRALTDQFDEQVKKFEELCRLWGYERHLLIYLHREGADADDVRDLWEATREGAEQCVAALQQQWGGVKNSSGHSSSTHWVFLDPHRGDGRQVSGREAVC
jgi:hypothetical protein